MKSILTLAFAFLITFTASTQKAKATDITTSVVAGVVVAHYVGTLAGVGVSVVLAGAATLIHTAAGKEAVAKAAMNDAQDYYLNGSLSLALNNTVKEIQAMDESISEEEAVDMVVASVNQ